MKIWICLRLKIPSFLSKMSKIYPEWEFPLPAFWTPRTFQGNMLLVRSESMLLAHGRVQVLDNRKPVFIALSENQGHFRSKIIFCASKDIHPLPWKGFGKLFRGKGERFINPQLWIENNCSSKWHSGYFSQVPNWEESGLVPTHKRGTKILKVRVKKPTALKVGNICWWCFTGCHHCHQFSKKSCSLGSVWITMPRTCPFTDNAKNCWVCDGLEELQADHHLEYDCYFCYVFLKS